MRPWLPSVACYPKMDRTPGPTGEADRGICPDGDGFRVFDLSAGSARPTRSIGLDAEEMLDES